MATNTFASPRIEAHPQKPTASFGRIAWIAGVLYLIIIAAGMFADGFARPSLIVPGDAAATVSNILASQGLFRLSIVSDLIMIVSDVAIGLAFYLLLRPVSQGLSLLSALFRLAQAATLGINLLMLLVALQLMSGADYLAVLGTDQLQAQALLFLEAHSIGYKIALVFFAFSLLIQGYLFIRSDSFPRVLGIMMVITALAYFADSFATFILVDYEAFSGVFEMMLMVTALPFELALGLWLLVKGIRTNS
ncbi:MAG: DUF4386 domain-containing protein [Anaerolineae bacterium]|nr:DUF4386 domain-containing protein [Anaerolineae bacterium]